MSWVIRPSDWGNSEPKRQEQKQDWVVLPYHPAVGLFELARLLEGSARFLRAATWHGLLLGDHGMPLGPFRPFKTKGAFYRSDNVYKTLRPTVLLGTLREFAPLISEDLYGDPVAPILKAWEVVINLEEPMFQVFGDPECLEDQDSPPCIFPAPQRAVLRDMRKNYDRLLLRRAKAHAVAVEQRSTKRILFGVKDACIVWWFGDEEEPTLFPLHTMDESAPDRLGGLVKQRARSSLPTKHKSWGGIQELESLVERYADAIYWVEYPDGPIRKEL